MISVCTLITRNMSEDSKCRWYFRMEDWAIKSEEDSYALKIIRNKVVIIVIVLQVFLRYFHEEKLNRLLLEMENRSIKIQAAYRGYQTRKM